MAKLTREQRSLFGKITKAYREYDVDTMAFIENELEIYPEIEMDGYSQHDTIATAKWINKLIYSGDYSIKRLTERLVDPELTEEMKKFISELGDTPMREEWLDATKIKDDVTLYNDIEGKSGISQSDTEHKLWVFFVGKCVKKVNSIFDDNGDIKRTEATDKIGLLTPKEFQDVVKIINQEVNIDAKNISDIIIGAINTMRGGVFDNSTEWEKTLCAEFIQRQVSQDRATYMSVFK